MGCGCVDESIEDLKDMSFNMNLSPEEFDEQIKNWKIIEQNCHIQVPQNTNK